MIDAESALALVDDNITDGEARDVWLNELKVMVGPSGLAGPGAVSSVF